MYVQFDNKRFLAAAITLQFHQKSFRFLQKILCCLQIFGRCDSCKNDHYSQSLAFVNFVLFLGKCWKVESRL